MGTDGPPACVVVVGTVKLDCPIGELLFDRRLAALRDYRTAEATDCESQLSGETPKYWAGPEELLPRYAVGILVGQLTEG